MCSNIKKAIDLFSGGHTHGGVVKKTVISRSYCFCIDVKKAMVRFGERVVKRPSVGVAA